MQQADGPRPWKLESSERVVDFGIFALRRDRVRSPRTGTLHDFQVLAAPDGVTVIALTQDDQLVLVEQHRHGTRRVSLETPSGLMDEGEEPTEAGLRELREETGYEGEDARRLGTVAVNPSWETSFAHVVLVRGARCTAARAQDAGEDTHVRLVPRARIAELVREGAIDSAVVVAALHLFLLQEAAGVAGGAS